MPWNPWITVPFDATGTPDLSALAQVPPNAPGVYCIATRSSDGNYHSQYIGRSKNDIRGRLQAHLSPSDRHGNKVIQHLLEMKRDLPSSPPNALHISFITTPNHKLIESAYLDDANRPPANLVRARLPEPLRNRQDLRDPQPSNLIPPQTRPTPSRSI